MSLRNLAFGMGLVSTLAAAVALTSRADAIEPPFKQVPAIPNIAALTGPVVPTVPPEVARVPADVRPTASETHRLGSAGYAWALHGEICVMMKNETGACFGEFKTPVLLFMTGGKIDGAPSTQVVTGVVPDNVASVVLVTDTDERVPMELDGNGVSAEVAGRTAITGEYITFVNGSTYLFPDALRPMP